MPEITLPKWLTPQIFISAANFLAIIFAGGMVWSSTQGEIATQKRDISDLKMEVRQIRLQDLSIAVLKQDVLYIKESLLRIEKNVGTR